MLIRSVIHREPLSRPGIALQAESKELQAEIKIQTMRSRSDEAEWANKTSTKVSFWKNHLATLEGSAAQLKTDIEILEGKKVAVATACKTEERDDGSGTSAEYGKQWGTCDVDQGWKTCDVDQDWKTCDVGQDWVSKRSSPPWRVTNMEEEASSSSKGGSWSWGGDTIDHTITHKDELTQDAGADAGEKHHVVESPTDRIAETRPQCLDVAYKTAPAGTVVNVDGVNWKKSAAGKWWPRQVERRGRGAVLRNDERVKHR